MNANAHAITHDPLAKRTLPVSPIRFGSAADDAQPLWPSAQW
jgi:hypothetical protein